MALMRRMCLNWAGSSKDFFFIYVILYVKMIARFENDKPLHCNLGE